MLSKFTDSIELLKYLEIKFNILQFNYPGQALMVPYTEMIRSKDFAEQLCFMYQELPIETEDQKSYISKWLVTLLADEKSRAAEPREFPVITKKIRDEVLGKQSCDYFRRSSFYMCTKVFLQQSLTVELGPDRGKLLYKLIMLQFVTQIIDFFNRPICKTLDIDLMTQSLAKLARRIEKLSSLIKNSKINEFDELYERFESQTRTTIGNIRKKIDNQIEHLQTNEELSAKLSPLMDLDFEADVEQKIPNLLKYLGMRKNSKVQNHCHSKFQVKRMHRHNRQKKTAPDLSVLKSMSSEIETTLFANDFECWVLYDFNIEDNVYNSGTLRDWTFDYLSIVDKFCIHDQISASRMVLTLLKLIAGLDFIACKEHHLLEQYRSCIDPNIIDSLLLPPQADMKIAFELEQYFRKRNSDAIPNCPGLIEEQTVSLNSFSVKFAAQNEEMKIILNEIKEMERTSIEAKKEEWKNGRDTVESLRKQTEGVEHGTWTNRYTGRTRHDRYCRLCPIVKQIKGIQIEKYERPLPKESHEQNAVVFELKCPIEIACLRDVLFCFAKLAENPKNFRFSSLKGDKSYKWISHQQNSRLCTSESELVMLGGRRSNICKQHVDAEFDTFIVENDVTPTFYGSGSSLSSRAITDKNIKEVCTLKTENEYSVLQWTLNGTNHTQNQVISKQSECHKELSLSEFKNFGSLRADGHRLQLRKLYGMIECESLSFDKSSVLSLVCQLLWEAGISGESRSIRESHMDFRNLKFATAMIELLDTHCEQQKSNWENPNKLLTATLIAARVFEINKDESLADRIVQLLDKIRTFALDWIEKVTAEIKKTNIKNIDRNKELHMKLLCVSISGAATFFINSNHLFFNKIFIENSENEYSAPRVWLMFAISIKNNILFNINNNSELPLNFRMLLRIVRYTGVHIESEIRSLISNDSGIFDDILKLTKNLWSRMSSASLYKWSFYEGQPEVLLFEVSVNGFPSYVIIDIVTGEFLVDNMPVDHVPNDITSAKHFQRVFENINFAVQPDSKSHFSTVHSYNNCNYEFVKYENETAIIERRNGIEKELIPHTILFNEIPHHLVENYSHFWNKIANNIEFRPKLFADRNFSNESGIEYRLDLNNRRLIHIQTERLLLDINSKSYLTITKQLSRLELPKYIHILMERPRIANIELIRMRLKFIVDTSTPSKSYDLVSNEFVRKRVCLEQKCGTLYGLQHGLMMESVPSNSSSNEESSKLLILPHGKIQSRRSNGHVSVEIDIEGELCSPSFHQYEVDDFCRQIRASSSSCSALFYLAYLHAVTSHGEIEPFIRMSGTERALQILQSGFAWSSEPYDDGATKMLYAIADLSPKRQMKRFLQQVDWPSFIPPRSARDSFVLIAQRLLEDSERLIGLHVKSRERYTDIKRATDCNKRQYLRYLAMNPNLRISDTFIQTNVMETVSLNIRPIDISKNTQIVSVLYHQRKYYVPHDLNLKDFLMSGKKGLDGPVSMDCIGNLLKHQTYKPFVDLWIGLYEYARKGRLNNEKFAFIWSVLAYEKNALSPILALQAIEMNQQAFESIDPPPVEKYQPYAGCECKTLEVKIILKSCHTVPDKYSWMRIGNISENEKREYNERIEKTINDLAAIVESNWPCYEIDLQTHCDTTDINIQKASEAISQKLKTWDDNRKLAIFLSSVEMTLKTLTQSHIVETPDIQPIQRIAPANWQKYEIDYKMKMCERLCDFQNEIQEARMIWQQASHTLNKSAQEWWTIYENLTNGRSSQHLIDAGLYPRTIPSLVLSQIALKEDSELKVIIGALAVTIAHEQRQNRIAIYSQHDHLKGALDREEQNQPHINWNPSEYPEWLLFEIEQNLSIRRIQVEVAKQMIDPRGSESKHSVMQLNMGEGKTAVITPIVAAILADGTKACQITVLKSLFATNLKSLRRYLGGMLNRRVYIFPCRRDMPVSSHVGQFLDIYQECMKMKGSAQLS